MSRLLERLKKYKEDRGMMANLRCVHIESKKHRAWPALNRLGVPVDDVISAFIAGLFATHAEETSSGNFGVTCKSIEQHRGDRRTDDNNLTPTERRFQHLLSAGTQVELHNRILRMVLMAKSQGIPVNYARLENDLKSWSQSDCIKTEWATSFWAKERSPAGKKEDKQ